LFYIEGCFAIPGISVLIKPERRIQMKTKSISQTITFVAEPEKIYNMLMNQEAHAAFTGSKVSIEPKVTGKFTVFDGYCHGYNIELIEGRKIVQAWHFSEDGWPEDHFTICTFDIEPEGNKTKLKFHQTNVPEQKVDALKSGWKEFYWNPMKEYLKVH
jgi:activator of HSP90 ATPase